MKVCCVFSLKSPYWGDSNEYKPYTIFNIKKKITLNYSKSAAMGFFSKGLKNEFETATQNADKRSISVQATEVLLYMWSVGYHNGNDDDRHNVS